ncbi:MocR-like pyridoxine biosynthesis transcription factor PdxR [Larkinella rosea]|uniref:PLP-dependent aminotransferase family protein n=1 Tax=Larkinella rosea TaxID=2025312 RepID=A0A3P1BK31_9BACT|nr:PLP-dependent aminotransferase family protein [Larkinella rosea]RRB00844.1 PLP-dependent aminotransferase family protein [Larkinella rosea]
MQQLAITVDRTLALPVYVQIAGEIIAHIQRGSIRPGAQLPGSRELAEQLQIQRKTVRAAYDELYAQSWIETRPRKGVFVVSHLPEVKPRPIPTNRIPDSYPNQTLFELPKTRLPPLRSVPGVRKSVRVFDNGFPDTRLTPTDLLIREYRRFANFQFTRKFLSYGPAQGSENLRIELARFLNDTRGLHISPDNILITKGAQMAMYLVGQLLISPGDTVMVGDPGFFGANDVFEQAGARIQCVPVDARGMDMDVVEAICRRKKVRLLYVVPHHHQPTSVTLSPERRMQLLTLSAQYGFAVLEDDYDYDFHYASSPVLPLASVDQDGSVIYAGSFCKTIAPAIRIGFLVAPENLIERATRLRYLIDRQGESLLEEAMANLLKNGDINRHLRKANKIYHERRDVLCQLLRDQVAEEIQFDVPDGGMGVWATYTGNLTSKTVAERAAALGLWLDSGENYYYEKTQSSHVRLGFASMNPGELEQAVFLLAKAVKSLR